eukprot:TRINITY_DN5840_c0_g1_i3.p1 TRINITY_DN5840_c0_g1~~TRINITY_DN5840_c0_g1_i3.p1  ORF type:complete len:4482 (-),score=987.95 TRINITY_DN5840_c0_g1_i3:157-13602(-)
MDSRLSWLSQRLIACGRFEDKAIVENLIRHPHTCQQIYDFFNGDGVTRLMFYYQIVEDHDDGTEYHEQKGHTELFLASPESDRLTGRAFYFTRSGTNPLDGANLDTDVYYGEIDATVVEHLEVLLSQAYYPMVSAQQDWGLNPDENTRDFIVGMRKFVDGLTETVKSLTSGIELTKPDRKFEVENKQPAFNRAATDPEILMHYEGILEDWCKQMERLVTESDIGRKESEDAGPNTELDYWKTRLSKFNSIMEQLKTKDCKCVLGVCTAAKSKILRRWKTLDNQITDATNEAKENVKYLTTLEKYIEPLYSGTPTAIMDILPGLLNGIKMMHTISRYFNTSERMVSLFSKITNQMITNCRSFLYSTGRIWEQDIPTLIRNFEACLRLNEGYQEQYRLTKDKLLTQPKGKQFDFNESHIFGKFEQFCKRIMKLTDIFSTIQQFSSLEDHKIDGMEAMIVRFKGVIADLKRKPYDPLDFTKSTFDRDYMEFNRNIQDIEASLQEFINKSFDAISNTEQALNMLKQFQAILQRENLKADLDSRYMQVFHNYGTELETVQKIYERNKHNPPIIRNAPPVAGNIIWARQLLRRIEEPMKKFQANKNIMSAKEAKRIVKIYNKVARALIEFETLWHLAWSKSIDAAKTALQATLIIRHPDNGKLYVNFDREILQLIRETKTLIRLGVEVPESARVVLLQEEKFKSYYDQLEYALNEYQRITSQVLPVCKSVLRPHLEDIDRKLVPGMMTLTWTSMNIDAFLHRIHTNLSRAEELISNINDILESRVERNLKRVSRLVLIDLEESKSYTLDEFVALQDAIIQKRVEVMVTRNIEVQTAIEDVINLITSYRMDSLNPNDSVDMQEVYTLRDHYAKLMYLAILNCIRNSLNSIKRRLGSRQSTGFFYVQRPFFDVDVELTIPQVSVNPSIDDVQATINAVSISILKSTKYLKLWGQPIAGSSHLDTFYDLIARDKAVVRMILLLTGSIEGLKKQVYDYLETFRQYNYLWKEDMHHAYSEFVQSNPTLEAFEGEMKKYLGVEQQIAQISPVHVIGALSLHTQSLKYSLKAEAASWKAQYAKNLHKQAHEDLQVAIRFMSDTSLQLKRQVHDIEDLRAILSVLRDIREKEAEIDVFFAPVEDMYNLLSKYEVRVSKEEAELVSDLRPRWKSLRLESQAAFDHVQQLQITFKRDLIRNIKAFQVDVIQFRNDYDANGPSVAGLKQEEAVERLKFFQRMFDERQRKWEAYISGEELFGLPRTDYPELSRTKKELQLLHSVYELLNDIKESTALWNGTVWKDLRIEEIIRKMDEYRTNLKKLPKAVRDWDVSKEIQRMLDEYSGFLPILERLSNPCIRTRHWIQIIQITNKSTRQDYDSMTLGMILEGDPSSHKDEIDEIIGGAENEQAIEVKIKNIEEHWVDQVFTFTPFKNRGPILLKSQETDEILELLDESSMTLGTMLTSRHILPFKEIVNAWMAKLSNITEIIEQLLTVQSKWSYLESVFTTGDISRQLPQESKRFMNIDKNWEKVMHRLFETRNVVHACVGNDSLRSLLPHLLEQLELCQKSLTGYMELKRAVFPRFYFVSDASLLEILSQGADPNNIQAHFQSLFENVQAMNTKPMLDRAGMRPMFGLTSFEGEVLTFVDQVLPEGQVEDYLSHLDEEIRRNVRIQVRDMAQNYGNMSIGEIVEKYIAQVGIIALQLIWSTETIQSIVKSKTEKNAVTNAFKRCSSILSEITGLISREASQTARAKLEVLAVVQLHQRDCFDELIRKRVKEPTEFDWIKQFRMTWKMELDRLEAHILDQEIPYCYEYIGCRERLVKTPLTDRCYVAMTQAIGSFMGGAPTGPAATGKTETVKDLARSIGKFTVVFNCSESQEFRATSRLLKGICRLGAWVVLDEINRVELSVLSVMAQLLQTIFQSLREKRSSLMFTDGTNVKLDNRLAVFITMNPGYSARQELPENLKSLFRSIAIISPDRLTIIRTKLASIGFQDHANLAKKFHTLYTLCEQQLSKAPHYDFGLRNILFILRLLSAARRTISSAAYETSIFLRVIRDTNMTRLLPEDIPLFLSLLSDIFPMVRVEKLRNEKLEQGVKSAILGAGLVASADWVEKIMQIHDLSSSRNGVIIVGPTGSGKSKAVDILLKTLSDIGTPHRVAKINPKAISNNTLFGFVNSTSADWTDGVLTAIWRKAMRQKASTTWILFDGPLDSTWIENLNTVLDDNRLLSLSSGERLPLTNNLRMLFESDSLTNASPTTITRLGIVYMTDSTVGWKPYIDSWLKTRKPSESAFLIGCFEMHTEMLYNTLKTTPTFTITLSLSSLVCSMVKLLASLLPECTDDSVNESLYEKFFFFSLAWSFGGCADNTVRSRIDQYIRGVCDSIPQASPEDTIFDFFVDENTCEWESWATTTPTWTIPESGSFHFRSTYLPTTESTRMSYLLSAYHKAGRPVILMGPSGAGKTSLLQTVFQNAANQDRLSRTVNCSRSTGPATLLKYLDSFTERRQGRSLGPVGGRSMHVLIEDLNVVDPVETGDQSLLECLRQLIEDGGVYSNTRIGEFQNYIDIHYIATMTPPGAGRYDVSQRLKRHFSFLSMNGLPTTTVEAIYTHIISHWLSLGGVSRDLFNVALRLPSATIGLCEAVRNKLIQTSGRYHYQFNMHEIARVFEGMTRGDCSIFKESGSLKLAELWFHECTRVFEDRLLTLQDRQTFHEVLTSICSASVDRKLALEIKTPVFFHSLIEAPEASINPGQNSPVLAAGPYTPIRNPGALVKEIESIASQYCSGERQPLLSTLIFDGSLELIARICRILKTPRGNAVLVGLGGSGKRLLSRFSSYICGYETHVVQSSKSYNASTFYEDMRRLFKMAGIHAKHIALLIPESVIRDDAIIESLNAFLGSGELPGLFSKDELDEILSDMRPIAKKLVTGFIDTWDNLFKFFVNRARDHVHVLYCLSPVSDRLVAHLQSYPSLMTTCQIDCFTVWPQKLFSDVAAQLLHHGNVQVSQEMMLPLSQSMATIHQSLDSLSKEFTIRYGRKVYVTPKNYISFIKLFMQIYNSRIQVIDADYKKTCAGLDKLNQAEEDVERLKVELQQKEASLLEAQKVSTSILSHITEKTAKAEKKKAEVMLVKNELAAEAQRISAEKQDCERDLLVAKPALDEAIQAVKSMQLKDIQSLKSMKSPPDLIRRIFDAVLILFSQPVIPVECVETKGRLSIRDSYVHALTLMSDVGFLSNIMAFPKDSLNDEHMELLEPYLAMEDFEFTEARKVSGNVAGLCKWVRAMYTYHEQIKVVQPKINALAAAEKRVAQANMNLQGVVAELEASQAELDGMHAEFDAAMAEKQKIQQTADHTRRKITDVNELVLGLVGEKNRWMSDSQLAAERRIKLLGDCLMAASFVNYAGPFNQEYREILQQRHLSKTCEEFKIPFSSDFAFVDFMTTKGAIRSWILHGLPNDEQSIQNAIIAYNASTPPLFVDPQGQGSYWYKEQEAKAQLRLFSVHDKTLLTGLEESLTQGMRVLIENVGEELDPFVDNLLEVPVVKGPRGYRVLIETREVDFSEDFRLVMVTKLANPSFAAEVYSKTTVIDFSVTPKGLESQLLARVMLKERADLEEKRIQLMEEVHSHKRRVEEMEEDVLLKLAATQGNLLDDTTLIEALSKTKRLSQELMEKLDVAFATEKRIEASREEYRNIASRGAVVFFLINELSAINYVYQISLNQFLTIFDASIKQAEKSAGTAKRIQSIIETLTYNAHVFVSRGLFESHKFVWMFMLATRIALSNGSVTPAEYGCFLRSGLALMADSRFTRKKPFEWIPDGTWLGIQQLTTLPNLENLAEMISRNEGFWRSWYDQEYPEDIRIPELDDRLTPFQKVLLVRTIREDRTMSAALEYVRGALGKRYLANNLLDFDGVLADSNPRRPIVLIISPGVDPSSLVVDASKKRKIELYSLSLGQGQDSIARKLLASEMRGGSWILLQNGHLSPKLMSEIELILNKTGEIHQEFRLFITTPSSTRFPASLLQMSVKVTNEVPQGLKHGLRRSYQMLTQDIIDAIPSAEWRAIVFSICFLHTVLQERKRFGPIGFCNSYEFSHAELMNALTFVKEHILEMEQKKGSVSWPAIKYILAEVLYGGKVTDEYDRRLLNTYCEMWMSKKVTEPNFYFHSTAYSVPKANDISKIRASIDELPNNDSPELFGLHPNTDITFRTNQVRTLLATLLEVQPKDVSINTTAFASREELLVRMIDDLLTRFPADFNMEDVREKMTKKLGGPKPINVLLLQEIERLQAVLSMVRSNASDLRAALCGTAPLTSDLLDVANSLAESRIPTAWLRISWPASSLPSWFVGITQRIDQMNSWLATGRPVVVWLGGFFNPLGFMTAMKQDAVRRKPNWALEDVVILVEILSKEREEIRAPPEEGVYVYGLYLDGAAWDKKANRLVDLPPRNTFSALPVALLTAVNVTDMKREQTNYACPCYKSPLRGMQNFLTEVDLRCEEDPYKWVMRGVALITNA